MKIPVITILVLLQKMFYDTESFVSVLAKAEKGRLYKPTSKLAELASTFQSKRDEEKSDKSSVK